MVGAALIPPGRSSLPGRLTGSRVEDFSTLETVGVVVLFNLIMLLLIELPLIGYAIAPDWTPSRGDQLQDIRSIATPHG